MSLLEFSLRSSLFALLIFISPLAQATSTPSTADAGRIGQTIKQNIPQIIKTAPLDIKGNAPFTAPNGAENIKFVLNDVIVDDSTIYTSDEITPLFVSKLGTTISLADVYSVAANLTAKYRNDGYILTQVIVPPQTISGGIVHLRVVEGKINDIKIDGSGALGSNASIISKYVADLKDKGALNNQNLEKALLLINDLPGVEARSVLSPSPSVVGASDLTILVDRTPYDGTVQVDNFGSRYLGMWEALANFNLNSAFGQNERLSAQLAYAPSDQGIEPELLYGDFSGSLPIGSLGTKIEANIGKSYTNPGGSLNQFDVLGKSYFSGLKISHPFVRTREMNLSSTLGLDRRTTETKSNVDTFKNDDVTSLRLGTHFDYVDTLFLAALTNVNLELSRGLDILGASEKGDSDLSRAAGDPTYTKISGDISRLERLNNQFSLSLSAKGQLSASTLLSAEEFGLGGANGIGRGYDPSEIVGEDGVGGSVELIWNSPYTSPWVDSYSVYGFYDIGKVWNDDAITANLREQSLASTGVGVRTNIDSQTRAGLMIALPLTREVAAENDVHPRLYMNFSRDF